MSKKNEKEKQSDENINTKENKTNDKKKEENNNAEQQVKEEEKTKKKDKAEKDKKYEQLNEKIKALENEKEEISGRLQRMAAEFDNYKKRTIKEKDAIYINAAVDILEKILPVADNMERAVEAAIKIENDSPLKDGILMVSKQLDEIFKDIGISEIDCLGQEFDPELHNAVMHVEDETIDENTVIEQFQKGYIYKDKVIRHSMVKVAN